MALRCMLQQAVVWPQNNKLSWLSAVLVFEAVLTLAVIRFVPYTEIDWSTYMQQISMVAGGERDYSLIRGDTGPMVYPAGYVWLFGLLYDVTGGDIASGQLVFALVYLATQLVVLDVYRHAGVHVPAWAWLLLCLSRRVHSIFVLRLFNDCWAMLLLWIAVALFARHHWTSGCVVFSCAFSIKMNIILFAPGLFLLLLAGCGIAGTLQRIVLCGAVQLILAWPFLLEHPISYIRGAVDLGRIFLYKWTVNWRFVPQHVFETPAFGLVLLACTAAAWILAFLRLWRASSSPLHVLRSQAWGNRFSQHPMDIVTTLLLSNFIGVCFCRTLHYQFYVWYFHSLVWLLWAAPFSTPVRLLVLAGIEVAFNVYPPRPAMSMLLHACHACLLLALLTRQTLSSVVLAKAVASKDKKRA